MARTGKEVASSIIEVLRLNKAFYNSHGITLNRVTLSVAFKCSTSGINYSLHKLLDSGVIIHKSGKLGKGSGNDPAHFVLAEEFETGDSWKNRMRVDTPQNTATSTESRPKHIGGPKIMISSVELAQKYSESLQKIATAEADNNNLREQLLKVLSENKTLKNSNEQLQSEIEDLKTSEHLASVDLMKANAEIRTLTSNILAENIRKERLERQIQNFSR